jgi:DNA replication protein DnaC
MAAIANVHGGVGFVAFTELLETIRAWWRLKGDDAHRFDPTRWAERVPWLFIDDVGTESSRTSVEMGIETLPQIINARYKAARPTCLTTNLSPDELSARYGARMVSRLTETCAWYEMAGDDRRLR